MGWYANLKIKNKLFAGYAIVAALSCVMGYFGLSGMGELKTMLDDTHDNLILSIIYVSDTDHNAEQHKREVLRYLGTADKSRRQAISALIRREENQMKEALENLDKMPLLDKERQILSRLRIAWSSYLEEVGRLTEDAAEGKNRDIWEMEKLRVSPLFSEVEELTRQLRNFNVDEADTHYHNSAGLYTRLRVWMWGLFLALIVLSVTTAVLITRSVTAPLNRGLQVVRSLESGIEEKTRITEAIANGDLDREISISAPIDIDRQGLGRDEPGTLLKSLVRIGELQRNLDVFFARMTESLRAGRKTSADTDWLKTGLNELNALMRGERRIEELAESALTYLAGRLRAGAGAFYLYDEGEETLVLSATYAFTRRKHLADRFRLGEGIIGQAALEKKMICLSRVPDDYLQISSALGESVPGNVVALPLLHDGRLRGALELAILADFTDTELDFLNQAIESVAIGLGVAYSRRRIDELLDRTQQQTEELRVQQEELQQSNEELEERAEMLERQRKEIEKKNSEIEAAGEKLKRKAEDIEKVSSYKSEFLANMSHELRTPLNSIMLLSRLLADDREKTLTDKQKEFAATINSAGRDLLSLINDVLDLSKVEAGRLDLHCEETRIAELCDSMEELFRQQAVQKGLDFKIEIDASVPETMFADGRRVSQILKNLLSNAFKFTEKGSVSLHVSTPQAGDSPIAVPSVAFRISDTGIGISQDKQSMVFQAFQQADGGTSRKFGGTGLGLSISLQLAKKMGGDITLSSTEGKGSVFTFYLPLRGAGGGQASSETPSQPADADGPDRAETPPFPAVRSESASPIPDDREKLRKGDRSILIIEDDLNFASTLMAMVRERGFGAIAAADGASGLHLADAYLPSAVILDVMLPGIDGWAVMRGLKDNPATRHIPVHFITCLDERQKGMQMGAVGFFTKPVGPEQLEEVFENIGRATSKSVKKLLIVEDDPVEAEAMRSLLEGNGLLISTAGTGAEAAELLKKDPADCLVLDLGLPDMSGFELLDRIHADPELRKIPVIIHTGREISHEEERKLRRYAGSIIIKGAKGPERLLNEVTLFLHMVESELPEEKKRMIRSALDKEAMLDCKKVLLVDDDMRNLFSLSGVLSEKNMVVLEAENGEEALARIADNQDVDLVLMDIMMPGMDGFEAIRRIRLDERFGNVPIIAMTAKAMAGDQEKCIRAGADDYISKPIDVDKLFSIMRVWLCRNQPG